MPKYVAFLRAINVGGRTVKMDQLRTLFEAIGFANVETFIASGNVIFDSSSRNAKALERKIEKHLHEALGYEVVTFIRSVDEVAEIANYQPFEESELEQDGNVLYVVIIADKPGVEVAKRLVACSNEVDEFHVSGAAVYWLCRKKFSESEFSGTSLEKVLQMSGTVRNSNTIKRIAAKYSK
jgi:uncharacterized protein (DUF1697 family)